MDGESSDGEDCGGESGGSDSKERDGHACGCVHSLQLTDETKTPLLAARKSACGATYSASNNTCNVQGLITHLSHQDRKSNRHCTTSPSVALFMETAVEASRTASHLEEEISHTVSSEQHPGRTSPQKDTDHACYRPDSRASLNSQGYTRLQAECSEDTCSEDGTSTDDNSSSSRGSSSFSLRGLTRAQKSILINTCLVDLLTFLSISVMAPFFPEEALKRDVSDTVSGWIFGIAPLVQFLFSPVAGCLVQFIGPKFMFSAGLFLSGGCTVLFGMLTFVPYTSSNSIFVLLAFLLQVVKSVGTASLSTAGFVLFLSAFPDNISTLFGIGEVFVGLGLVAGPALGGILYGLGGFLLPFTVMGGLSLVLLLPVVLTLPSDSETDSTGTTGDKIPIAMVLRSPTAIVTSLAIMVSTFSWSILDPTLEPSLRPYQLSPAMTGVVFLVMAGAYAFSAPVWGWVADMIPDQRALLIPGFIIAAFGLLLLGPSQLLGFDEDYGELWLVILSLVVLGISASMSSVPTFDLYLTVFENLGFDDDTRTYGIVSGLWMSMYSFGDFLGPSMGGVLLDYVGFSWMTSIAAGSCLLMALCLTVSWMIHSKCSWPFCKGSEEHEPLMKREVTITNGLSAYSTFADLLQVDDQKAILDMG